MCAIKVMRESDGIEYWFRLFLCKFQRALKLVN